MKVKASGWLILSGHILIFLTDEKSLLCLKEKIICELKNIISENYCLYVINMFPYCLHSSDSTFICQWCWSGRTIPVNRRHSPNAVSMLAHRLRRWLSIETALGVCLCLLGQDSLLGPLLFLVYNNDLATDLECDPLLFADDTSLLDIFTNPLTG